MKRDELLNKLREKFPQAEMKIDEDNSEAIYFPSYQLEPIADYLKHDAEMDFDLMNFMTAVDYMTELELVYNFSSIKNRHHLTLKTRINRDNPQIPAVCLVYPTAEWFEREVFDLFGVHFSGHPDLTRIMMPEDWPGHPLRKDYMNENLIPLPNGTGPVIPA